MQRCVLSCRLPAGRRRLSLAQRGTIAFRSPVPDGAPQLQSASAIPVRYAPGRTGRAVERGEEAARLPLLDDEALRAAAEIAVRVGKPRCREPGAVGADPGYGIEQNPFAHRLARHADGEVGVEEGPLRPVQRA